MKKFTTKDYNKVKSILENNKVNSKDLDMYIKMKNLRYKRYKLEITASDKELEDILNGDKDEKDFLNNKEE